MPARIILHGIGWRAPSFHRWRRKGEPKPFVRGFIQDRTMEISMADGNGGGNAMLGVIVGALLIGVVVIG
ncbi:MAG: hypothetical protein JO167_03650, partial [Alphaproteobacteria bacterium]|nr:hypothetical protein [Alphaproteobacteria bacterium]